jgi:sugar/nucleoside kinase (ribokinase family)
MSLLVTGSIAIDTLETPLGRAENVLGGSAIHFALAASQFAPVRIVAAVGEDFDHGLLCCFDGKHVDTLGIEVRKGSKTFRWHGRYTQDMNDRETVEVRLNVLAEAGPKIPPAFRDSRYVFLANTHPALQREFVDQLSGPDLVVCDTMNLWIETERAELLKTLGVVHGVVLNDAEARMLTGRTNLVSAGRAITEHGPRFVVIKVGEHGSLLVTRDRVCVAPAFKSERVKDPTGAGDSFAGGMMGYLAAAGNDDVETLKASLVRGTVAASFTIEDFSLDRLRVVSMADFERRCGEYFDMLPSR